MFDQIGNFSPVVVGVVLFVLGVGGGAVMLTPPDYTMAKLLWSVAAFVALLQLAYFVITTQSTMWERIVFAILTFGMLGGAWAWSMSWIEQRAKLTSSLPIAAKTEILPTTTESVKPSPLPKIEHDQVSQIEDLLSEVPDPEYRRLVAAVIHALDPKAEIAQGALVNSPDGTRKIDVSLRSPDSARLTAIDIVDLPNGKKAGLDIVDAAHSKMKDIKADVMLICSKTGFDDVAIKKAKRVKIGLITVLRQGDQRVKAVVEEVMYMRQVDLNPMIITYDGATERPPADVPLHDLKYKGESLDGWLIHRAMQIVMNNPTNTSRLNAHFKLKVPTEFELGEKRIILNSFSIEFQPHAKWFSQVVRLNATTGIYDYVRGKLRYAGDLRAVNLNGIDINKATPMSSPPELEDLGELMPGEIDMRLIFLDSAPGVPYSPTIESLVRPEDLSNKIESKR